MKRYPIISKGVVKRHPIISKGIVKRDHLAGVNESFTPFRPQGESKKQNNRRETPAAETLFFASQKDRAFSDVTARATR